MTTVYVDGKKYEMNETDNLLQACLSCGLDIPYFCWHPKLGSVGSCRQCAVKQYQNNEDSRGRIIMSCMTPVSGSTFISIDDSEAKLFRKRIIELLMINHPHDCPVCEEGGNCHLQDMTVMSEHNVRRYRFTKRTHRNQNLGPFISHEMNRCITCYRCIRYYKDYADGKDFGVYGTHDNIYFGRVEDGLLESEFSGNLVEICPTGVFTDKTHSQRYNRKWDMQYAPSICQQCSVGCNISPGERYGELRRIENRYNSSVNHYFLCDRGRFGYGYVNRKDRPRQPMKRRGNKWIILDAEQAINNTADLLRQSKKIIGIGSVRASIESNFSLRELVGADNFSTGMSENEQICLNLILKVLREGGIYTPTIHEIESYDMVIVLGEDLTQTSARVALAVRQAVKGKTREIAMNQNILNWQVAAILNAGQHAKHPLFITNVDKTHLDDIAVWSYYAPVEDQARLAFAIAHEIDKRAPAVKDFNKKLNSKVNLIVQAMVNAKKPLIISGMHSGSKEIIESAANLARALKDRGSDVGITLISSVSNSIGLGLIGGMTLDDALCELENRNVDTVLIMENDLYRHAPKSRIDTALSFVNNVVVLDHQRTRTTEKAHIILSSASFAEGNGTLVNLEGRAQRFFQVYDPSWYDNRIVILDSWKWLHALHSVVQNCRIIWTRLDHVINTVICRLPQLKKIKDAAPDASFRIHGQKLARSPHRFSGRTATHANINVHEPRQPQDLDTMFSFSMEGNNQTDAPRSDIPFVWSPGWNSPQAWNKFQDEVGRKLRNGDPGVRLFETSSSQLEWFNHIPNSFVRKGKDIWRVAPYYSLFGSEELTQRAPVMQHHISKPFAVLNPTDASDLDLNVSLILELTYAGEQLHLPVRFSDTLHVGQVGIPIGMHDIPVCLLGSDITGSVH